MKIVTWNLRCVWNGDGKNAFIHRAGMIYDKIRKEQPDLIAFQEVIPPSLDLLEKLLSEYVFFGQMRSENYDGEGLYTAVKKQNFDLLGGETFWLSPTPYRAGSRFEKQSPCPRICVVTYIRDKRTGETFEVYNVHLDHQSDEARVLGLDCILAYMREKRAEKACPQVLLGDFNAEPDSGVIKTCNAQKEWFEGTADVCATFHDYGKLENYKIDYIYLSTEWKTRLQSACAWTDCHEGIYLSDHYPVCIEIKEKE